MTDALPREEHHRTRIERFLEMRDADPAGALEYARAVLADAPRWRRHHPQRADALELLALAHNALEDHPASLEAASAVVRIRRRASPREHDLLALALGLQAVGLFAAGRSEDADVALREQLVEWRQALPPDDIRLAQKLEAYAEYVAAGFGRQRSVCELLAEAVAIRRAHQEPSRGRLASTLQQLALAQIALNDYPAAARTLAEATSLLEGEIARDPEREENRAGLSQLLILRTGLAGALGRKDEAIALADAARRIPLQDRVLRAENDMLIAAALSKVFEHANDIDRAIAEQAEAAAVLERNRALLDRQLLDRALCGDILASLGSLYLQARAPDLADDALTLAEGILGETVALLFHRATLEEQRGDTVEALRLYRGALRLRKEGSTEMPIFFGTNRQSEPGMSPGVFCGRPGTDLSFGSAHVLVPGAQFSTSGWIDTGTPPPVPVGRATNPDALVIRPGRQLLTAQQLQAQARRAIGQAQLYPRSALVFIHGYNVTFDQALRRGAQLVRDLNYDGAAFVFSWPSRGSVLRYGTDRSVADKAAEALASFLATIADVSEAEKLFLIAHSMGNRVLLPALRLATSRSATSVRGRIAEVILAAPALPRADFSAHLDALRKQGVKRFTLYASRTDRAMQAGYLRERLQVLAGYVARGEPVLHPGVQSIDISAAGGTGLSDLNHDVFASNPVMTEDIRQLLQKRLRPPHRRLTLLEPRPSRSGINYWVYRAPDRR